MLPGEIVKEISVSLPMEEILILAPADSPVPADESPTARMRPDVSCVDNVFCAEGSKIVEIVVESSQFGNL